MSATAATAAQNDDDGLLLANVAVFRRRIEQLMRKPSLTTADAQQVADLADLLRDTLALEDRASRLLTASDYGGGSTLAGHTLADAASIVLDRANVPCHARDIAVGLRGGGWRNPRRPDADLKALTRQVTASLSRHPDFQRVAPNTFARSAWGARPERRTRPRRHLPIASLAPGIGAKELTEADDFFDAVDTAWPS